ncbi:MAG: adenosylmethionine decarboxylase [Chloroflexota bacterium]
MNALGRHMLLECKHCRPGVLNDLEFLRTTLLTAATECGATVLGDSFHPFEPQGVSGVVIIAESHISIHTWPEYDYAAVDIFTCGTNVQPDIAAQVIIEKLEAKDHSVVEIQRGLLAAVPA